MKWKSSILTKVFGELFVLSELRLINRGFSSLQCGLQVSSSYNSDVQLALIFEVKPTLWLSLFALAAWSPFAITKLPKFLGQLQPSHWLIHSISNQDAYVTSTEILCDICELLIILRSQIVWGIFEPSF